MGGLGIALVDGEFARWRIVGEKMDRPKNTVEKGCGNCYNNIDLLYAGTGAARYGSN